MNRQLLVTLAVLGSQLLGAFSLARVNAVGQLSFVRVVRTFRVVSTGAPI